MNSQVRRAEGEKSRALTPVTWLSQSLTAAGDRLWTRFTATTATLALASLALLLYWPALSGPFLLDDFANLPQARPSGASLAALWDATFSNRSGIFGRPLSAFSFALNYLSGADGPAGFKLVNLGIHLLNSVLFGVLAFRLIGESSSRSSLDRDRMPRLALILAVGVFAAHPLQVSSVMYVVQRMALLSATACLAGLALYVHARTVSCTRRRRILCTSAFVPLTLVAMLCKENGILLPGYVLLLEITVFRFRPYTFNPDGRAVERGLGVRDQRIALLGLGLVGLLTCAGLYFSGALDGILSGYASLPWSVGERMLTQIPVMVDYLQMVFVPGQESMPFYHDDVEVAKLASPRFLGAAAVLAAVVSLTLSAVGRLPLVAFGASLYLLSHTVESTFFPLEMAFEHRNYIGIAGLGLVVAALLVRIPARPGFTCLVAAAVLATLALQTQARARIWADDLSINAFAVAVKPESLRARSAYAISLSSRGDVDGALEQLQAGRALAPSDPYFALEILQTAALGQRLSPSDVRAALDAIDNGRIERSTQTVLADILSNFERGLLVGVDATLVSELYKGAERSTRNSLAVGSHALLVARAAQAHLLAGDLEAALRSIIAAVELQPQSLEMALRRLEIGAGVDPEGVTKSVMSDFSTRFPRLDKQQGARFTAVLAHLRNLGLHDSGRPDSGPRKIGIAGSGLDD